MLRINKLVKYYFKIGRNNLEDNKLISSKWQCNHNFNTKCQSHNNIMVHLTINYLWLLWVAISLFNWFKCLRHNIQIWANRWIWIWLWSVKTRLIKVFWMVKQFMIIRLASPAVINAFGRCSLGLLHSYIQDLSQVKDKIVPLCLTLSRTQLNWVIMSSPYEDKVAISRAAYSMWVTSHLSYRIQISNRITDLTSDSQ